MASTTALLIIDVQVGLVDGSTLTYRRDELLATLRGLIDAAHTADNVVVYIQDDDVGGVGSPAWQIHPAIAPAPGDLVLRKPYADSFYETTLQQELNARGITHLLITGMKSEVCVDMTSRRAVALGYRVTLVADAHSTTDNEVLSAAQIVAYHNWLLDGFGAEDGFGQGERSIDLQSAAHLARAMAPHTALESPIASAVG